MPAPLTITAAAAALAAVEPPAPPTATEFPTLAVPDSLGAALLSSGNDAPGSIMRGTATAVPAPSSSPAIPLTAEPRTAASTLPRGVSPVTTLAAAGTSTAVFRAPAGGTPGAPTAGVASPAPRHGVGGTSGAGDSIATTARVRLARARSSDTMDWHCAAMPASAAKNSTRTSRSTGATCACGDVAVTPPSRARALSQSAP